MDVRADKVMSLSEAIKNYFKDGSHISIGGFTVNRNPMAAVYEIIRQGIKNLHVYAHSNGTGGDELGGGGCVGAIEIAYGGNGRAAPTCIRFKQAIQKGMMVHEDYSNYQMSLRFHAGAMGVPFLPTRSSLGTDIVNKWGFSRKMRKDDPRLPDDKLIVMDNPFGDWAGCAKVVLVPAINPDVTIIHVQKADRQGTCRIRGLQFCDVDQAKAARAVIVTCEELVDAAELRADPEYNQIPFIHVSAVVPVPTRVPLVVPNTTLRPHALSEFARRPRTTRHSSLPRQVRYASRTTSCFDSSARAARERSRPPQTG
jgi:glutaconate CoA-transferase subunit A